MVASGYLLTYLSRLNDGFVFYKHLKSINMTNAQQFAIAVGDKYPRLDYYEQSIQETKLCKYQINFKDGSTHIAIMTRKQRDGIFRGLFVKIVKNTTGLGFVKPRLKSKLVEYAYASSVIAENAGYGSTGCWFVRLYPTIDTTLTKEKPLAYFPDKAAAFIYADSLPYEYNNMIKYINR